MSSPGSSVLSSAAVRPGLNSPTPSFRPFDRRFQSRISSSASHSPRASSPALLSNQSRNVSVGTNFWLDPADGDTSPPWDVVRWTRLRKLNGNVFSELGRRNFGSPTCLAVSAVIVLGTSKGIILLFDYSQNLKMIIGQATKGELSPGTCLARSPLTSSQPSSPAPSLPSPSPPTTPPSRAATPAAASLPGTRRGPPGPSSRFRTSIRSRRLMATSQTCPSSI